MGTEGKGGQSVMLTIHLSPVSKINKASVTASLPRVPDSEMRCYSMLVCWYAQAVSCRPLAAETRGQFQASPCGIFGGQSGISTVFFSEIFGFPLSVSFHQRWILIRSSPTDSAFDSAVK